MPEAKKQTPSGRFLDRLVAELDLHNQAKGKTIEDRMVRHWLGQEVPGDHLPAWPVTMREQYFSEVFREYTEIFIGISRLELAARFLQKLRPHQATAEAIAYHIEKHLEEAYIVKERLVAFLKRIERRLTKHDQSGKIPEVVRVRAFVEKSFEGIVKIKGVHVHQGRFEDEDVRRVASLDLLVKSGGMTELESLRRQHAQRVLAKWRQISTANVEAAKMLLDQVVEAVESVVVRLAPENPSAGTGDEETIVPSKC